jgi:hypothetical protein
MSLPSGPFVCKNIDREPLLRFAAQYLFPVEQLENLVAAALGKVIPAEVDYSNPPLGDPMERYRTEWQPVVSTNQSHSESGLVVEPVVSDKDET